MGRIFARQMHGNMQPIFKENLKADGFFPSHSYKKWTLLTHFLLNSCLGDWFVGKNHYFAVANTKESRKDEKYRCFMKNREDDYFLGVSITPECNTIKTVEKVYKILTHIILHKNRFYVKFVQSSCCKILFSQMI